LNKFKKSIGVAGLLLVLVLAYWPPSHAPDAVPGQPLVLPGMPVALPVPQAPALEPVLAAAVRAVAPASVAAASALALPKVFEMPELTRRVADAPAIRIGDRDWKVLGTRDISNNSGPVTTLLLRDEASGQIDYRQSVLRFVLVEGQDYEAFIRSRSQATRVFVNPLYGDIAVDASRIAAEYAELAGDRRVSKVMFVPLEVRRTAK